MYEKLWYYIDEMRAMEVILESLISYEKLKKDPDDVFK